MNRSAILEAITPSRIGGAEVFVANLCAELSKLGSYVELWCPKDRPFEAYAREKGLAPKTWKTFGKLDPLTVVRLARLIKQGRFDAVHTHLSTASLLGAFASRLARRPSIAHVHGLNTATCFKYSSRIIAVSDAVRRHLAAQGIPAERIRVVHNGVDVQAYQPVDLEKAKNDFGYEPDAPLFGVFGRLSPEKGQRVAIEAMFLIQDDIPNARLVIAGDGPERESLLTCARVLGVADRVDFVGFVKDVRHLMSACDVVVVPSLKEGFGLVAVEAMALERPVAASATGGLPEIVLQGETGILVAPEDPKALAQALLELAQDAELRSRLGRNGRRRVEEEFNLSKQSEKILQILMEPHTGGG
ncbi:MAG: glycosyltransferase family 4 protein [Armatimonadota bacterium]|nr:glycosyltransferase family 4 protein [Armatimonadota bacterium]